MKTLSFLIWTYPWKFHCVVSTFWQRCQRQRWNYVENRLLTLSQKLNIERNVTCRLGKYSRQKTVLWIISFPSFSRFFFLKPNAPVVCRIKVSISYSHSYFSYINFNFQQLVIGFTYLTGIIFLTVFDIILTESYFGWFSSIWHRTLQLVCISAKVNINCYVTFLELSQFLDLISPINM